MESQSQIKIVSDIFSINKKYVYNEQYCWNDENTFKLWTSIFENISFHNDVFGHKDNFLSLIVVCDTNNDIELDIIDGKQQLTALTIFLITLCEKFVEIDKKFLADSIYDNYIIGRNKDGERYFKLENKSYLDMVQNISKVARYPSSDQKINVYHSYDSFSRYLSRQYLSNYFELDDKKYEQLLKAIRDQALKHSMAIFINVNDKAFANQNIGYFKR